MLRLFGESEQLGRRRTGRQHTCISAYNSFDHHSQLGWDTSAGPGNMTSGMVKTEDRCRRGNGIFIEPNVVLGPGCQIASGAVVVGSVPAEHRVKARVLTMTVVSTADSGACSEI